jgi:hypothetical protein
MLGARASHDAFRHELHNIESINLSPTVLATVNGTHANHPQIRPARVSGLTAIIGRNFRVLPRYCSGWIRQRT